MTESLSKDQAFINRLNEIVLTNLNNENFGVSDLAKEAGLSRSIIHRRLREIKGQNISQFIREIRLKRAMELLQLHAGPASDIAFQVGFGSPAYFNTCFHKYYGYPPGEVRKRIQPAGNAQPDTSPDNGDESLKPGNAAEAGRIYRIRINRTVKLILSFTAVLALALVWYLVDGSLHKTKDLSIIVLPFKNLSDDPNNQYIADGVMEDIINQLCQIRKLVVISRTTSEHYRQTRLTAREIAREVNARNVLEGSLRKYGDKARISIQLIDAVSDKHLWSHNFDRNLNDILGIQGDIALHVANELSAELTSIEIKLIGEIPTRNPVAYDNYLRGRFLLNKSSNDQRTDLDKEGHSLCLQHFEKAIAADTNFAEAYAGLAAAYMDMAGYGWLPFKEGFGKGKVLFEKALKLDPDCVEAHTLKGSYHVWGDHNYEEARKELLTALQLKPDYPAANQYYAQLLMIVGPIEEARSFIDQSLKLEPYFWVLHNLNAYIYYFEGKNKEALQACQIARDLKKDYILNNWLFFLNYARLGDGENTAKELQKIIGIIPGADNYAGEIPEIYNKSDIEGIFRWMIDLNINRPIPMIGLNGNPFFISWWYAILKEKEKSIYWLQRTLEQGGKPRAFFDLIATNPDFDFLRDDARFQEIIDKNGLHRYNTRKARD